MKIYGFQQVSNLPTNASVRDVVFLTDGGDGGSLYEYNGSHWVQVTTSNYAQYKPTHTVSLTSTVEEIGVNKIWALGNPIPTDSATTFPVGVRFKIPGIVTVIAPAFNAIATFSLGYDISNYTTIEFNGMFNAVQTTVVGIAGGVAELNFLNSNSIYFNSGSGAPLVELTLLEAQVTQPSAFISIPTLQKFTCNTMSTIAASTFQQCASLQTVILPAVTTIAYAAFAGCTVVDLDLSDFSACNVIYNEAFAGCTALPPHITNQHFPNLTYLGSNVFAGSNVGRIELPTVTSVDVDGPIFTSVGHIQLNGLSSIQGASFWGCTSYILEFAGCTSVGDGAFTNWSPVGAALSWLYLPAVTTWGTDVFYGVSGLSVTLTIRTDQQSNPNVLYLQANNDVTLILVILV
jgi:hypothetical protein